MKDKSWRSSLLLCNNPIILVSVSEQDYTPPLRRATPLQRLAGFYAERD